MARPNKNNAVFFTHDADMRNDVKVRALRRQFPHLGYEIWCYILETLTDSESFEIDFTDIGLELLAADYEVTPQQLTEIVDYCCRINLLQRSEDGSRLYSEAHQRRFAPLIDRRFKLSEAGKRGMEKRWKGNKVVITNDNEVITSDNIVEKSKEDKSRGDKSKVKENKEKKNKEKDKFPYDVVVRLWNETCKTLPQVKTLNDSRRQKIKNRLNEIAPNDPMGWKDKIQDLFNRVAASDFLTGSNGWHATFDWIFENDKNWVKVMEGNYDNENRMTRKAGQQFTTINGSDLGIGERVENGRRTYGTGIATIPFSAPPRPSDKHSWDTKNQTWILL